MKDLRQRDVTTVPRFANVATFMRSQLQDTPAGLDIAMFGVPFDLGSSFRSGARHGPAQIREMSRLIREVNYTTKVAPFDLCRIADFDFRTCPYILSTTFPKCSLACTTR